MFKKQAGKSGASSVPELANPGVIGGAISDEAKLAALLSSPDAERRVIEHRERLLNERHRHAEEISKIDAEQLARLPEFDQSLATAYEAILKAQEVLAAARVAYLTLEAEKSSFLARSNQAKKVHANELRISAPYLDDAIAELRELYYKHQNIEAKESVSAPKLTIFGNASEQEVRTDASSAQSWYVRLAEASRALEAMKLDADFTRFPERIERIKKSIKDPSNFPTQVFTVRREAAQSPLRDAGRRTVIGGA